MRYPTKLEQQADDVLAARRWVALGQRDTYRAWLCAAYPDIPEAQNELGRLHARLGVAKIRGRDDEVREIGAQISETQDRLRQSMVTAGVTDASMQPPYTCPACEDRGYIDGKPCACRQTILNELVYEQLCDVSPVQDCTFDAFGLHYYDGDARQAMAGVLESCRRYARDFGPGAKNLLFAGPPGLGKTHLSLAIAEGVAHSGHLVMYASAPHLTSKLEDAKFRQSSEGLEYKEVIYGCELLVIDDLSAEMVTRYTQSEVYDLINSRINTNLPTIINTNLSMNEIEKLYGNRVSSRLAGAYAVIQFRGRDIRLQKRMEEVRRA